MFLPYLKLTLALIIFVSVYAIGAYYTREQTHRTALYEFDSGMARGKYSSESFRVTREILIRRHMDSLVIDVLKKIGGVLLLITALVGIVNWAAWTSGNPNTPTGKFFAWGVFYAFILAGTLGNPIIQLISNVWKKHPETAGEIFGKWAIDTILHLFSKIF